MYNDYERMITIIKPNDVLYSRDLHAIDIMNKIILDKNFDVDKKDKLFLIITNSLNRSKIKYSIHEEYNAIMLAEESWDSFICKKNGNFITKEFYDKLKEYGLIDLVYETKLSFYNKSQMENLDLNSNTIILNSDYIDDIKILERSGVIFKKDFIYQESKYLDFIISAISFRENKVKLFLNIFTSSIDDLVELYNKVKDNTYLKTLLKDVRISMMFITMNKYNESKIEEYNKLNVPAYGLINIFDQALISKINVNNIM